jgi:cobalt-zinc-cadmium efflux system outer membrane protein
MQTIRNGVILGLLVLVWAGTARAQTLQSPCTSDLVTAPASLDGTLNLAEVLQAVRRNLDVGVAQDAAAAARADVQAADHAPLPVLSVKASQMDLQNGLDAGNLWSRKRVDKSLGLDWTWERGGKRASRTLAAQRYAQAAQADVWDIRVQQEMAGLEAYYDLLAAQQRFQEMRAIEQTALQLADTARRRFQAGDVSAQETARIEIEAQRSQAETRSAQLEVQQAVTLLSQLMGRVVSGAGLRALPAWPELSLPTMPADLTALVEQRADVQAALARMQAADAALSHALALRQADITWGVSVDHYPGTSTRLLELRLQAPLQIGYAYQGEIARAQAEAQQAQNALERARLLALADLQRLQNNAQAALDRARRYELDILPKAQQVAQRAELAWAKGAMPVIELLDARRTLRATQIDAMNARADFARTHGSWLLRTCSQELVDAP